MTDPLAAGDDAIVSRWIVLTPSVDDRAWRIEIARAAAEAGLAIVNSSEHASAPADAIRITSDAHIALAAGASRIVAIVPEPATAPEAVGDLTNLDPMYRARQASLLLAYALALAPTHSVITAKDLAQKPAALTLFGTLRIVPPVSQAELSRDPARATAFQLYASVPSSRNDPIVWAENLFNQDPRSAYNYRGPGVLDTTGRSRLMVEGPFMCLPPGHWRGTIRFGVDAAAARHQYRLDWGNQSGFASEHVTPSAPGMYELELDHVFSEVADVHMRLFLMEGSFSGTLIFEGLKIQLLSAPEN